jgi:hypothetical protein
MIADAIRTFYREAKVGKNKKKKKQRRESMKHMYTGPAIVDKKPKPEAVQVRHDEKRGIVCSECGRPVSECVC